MIKTKENSVSQLTKHDVEEIVVKTVTRVIKDADLTTKDDLVPIKEHIAEIKDTLKQHSAILNMHTERFDALDRSMRYVTRRFDADQTTP